MKKIPRLLCFLTLLIPFLTQPALATHQVGSDMTWTCDPNNPCLYTFTYTFYRDCPNTGAGVFPPNLNFTCLSGNGNLPTSTGNWTAVGNPTDITPVCPGQQSDCNGGNVPGVLAFTFTRTYDFCVTPPCDEYQIVTNNCCRSNLITSLPNPTNFGSTSISTIVVDPNNCNSSPDFNTDPVVYICNGQNTTFAMGATDADGDQLRYTLVPCMNTATAQVLYQPGFGPNEPLGPNWDVALDPATGDINFTPIGGGAMEVGVMCVLVEEVRNGQVIGSVVRDIEVRVINCNNDLPELSGVDGTNDFQIDMCVGEQTCFTITSSDANPLDNLTLTEFINTSGATGTINPTNPPSITYCWTPTKDDVGNHSITLGIQDDACPIVGNQQFTYGINVDHCDPCDTLNIEIDWDFETELLDVTVNNNTSGSPITFTEYIWNDGGPNDMFSGNHSGPVNHTFPGPGTYTVCVKTLTFIGDVCCHDSVCKEITVYEDPCDEHEANWSAICWLNPPCTYTFFDMSQPSSMANRQVYWDFGNGTVLTGSPITYTFPGSGTYTITMTSVYHPPNDPSLCCYSTRSYTWNVHCGIGPVITNESTLKTTSLAWDDRESVLGLHLSTQLVGKDPTTVEVYDMNGKLLRRRVASDTRQMEFDFTGLASGVYFIRMVRGEAVETRKFAKP